ncbi:hypothetical protein BKA70DRAFT_1343632 [Coprinopsis sp. MPI-PUGE-AT-0042]|nr:hypothetical protein BKA70DRAFT_1343632 [Coprinopsis sp. MPI-PUGE-AT-0042]
MDDLPVEESPVHRVKRIRYVATFLHPPLLGFQLCIVFLVLYHFHYLSLEQRKARARYVYLSLLLSLLSMGHVFLSIGMASLSWGDGYFPIDMDQIILRKLSPTLAALEATISLIGDAFWVWRATIIWGDHHFLKWVPLTLYLIRFGTCIGSWLLLVCRVSSYIARAYQLFDDPMSEMERGNELIRLAQTLSKKLAISGYTVSTGLSLATTALIIIRLLSMKRKMASLMGGDSRFRSTIPYGHVIAVLLESALPLAFLSTVGAISEALAKPYYPNHINMAGTIGIVIYPIWASFLALGPQIVIVQIMSGWTWTSTSIESSPPSQPIIFNDGTAVDPAPASLDEEQRTIRSQVPHHQAGEA